MVASLSAVGSVVTICLKKRVIAVDASTFIVLHSFSNAVDKLKVFYGGISSPDGSCAIGLDRDVACVLSQQQLPSPFVLMHLFTITTLLQIWMA